nr:hypothetical protein [Tanacetum cinerariifolium]
AHLAGAAVFQRRPGPDLHARPRRHRGQPHGGQHGRRRRQPPAAAQRPHPHHPADPEPGPGEHPGQRHPTAARWRPRGGRGRRPVRAGSPASSPRRRECGHRLR